jgi:hypothetical protein
MGRGRISAGIYLCTVVLGGLCPLANARVLMPGWLATVSSTSSSSCQGMRNGRPHSPQRGFRCPVSTSRCLTRLTIVTMMTPSCKSLCIQHGHSMSISIASSQCLNHVNVLTIRVIVMSSHHLYFELS